MARLTRPDALLFDFGGTLFDDEFDVAAGEKRMIELAEGEFDPDEYMRIARELAADIHLRRLESQIEHAAARFTRLVGDCVGASFPQSDSELDLEFWKAAEVCTPVPGARDIIEMVASERVPLGIVSNLTFGREVLAYELEKVGWQGYFTTIVSSSDYGIRKPHAALFRACAGRMGVDPARCWYVGNWAAVDVTGAQSAGMAGIWLNRHGEALPEGVTPDAVITSWAGFADLWRDTAR